MALFHAVYLLIIPSHLCFATASKNVTTGFSLKLIHGDSPESPLYPGNLTFNERMSRYAKASVARASYLGSLATKKATIVDNPNSIIRPSVFVDGVYYMVSLGIGTPKQDIWLLLDTGASLSWVQCDPCENCYKQKSAIYDSRNSESFKRLPCGNRLCSDILRCNDRFGLCFYDMTYGGGAARTIGYAMFEKLTFPTDDQQHGSIDKIILGCSKTSTGFTFGSSSNIGGIMGLNYSPHSLVSQLDGMIQRNFSYCLTPGTWLSAYLRFRSDIVVRGTGPVQRTPFVRLGAYWYGLNLNDISIGNKRIGYPEGTFAPKEGGQGGCFIDSGAPFTVIERAAFNVFITAFENFFLPDEVERNTDDCAANEYCYYGLGEREYPSMTLHFEGADYIVPTEYLVFHDPHGMFFKLMILPGDITILGANHQHNMRLIYDLNEGSLLFVPEDCSQDV